VVTYTRGETPMSIPYYAVVSVLGTTDVQSVIADFKAFSETKKYPMWNFEATEPWTFEDKMAVRFRFEMRHTQGWEELQEFSQLHPTLLFDLVWSKGENEPAWGELLISDNKVLASAFGGFRSEVGMSAFLEPTLEFFINHVEFTLPQLFKYRLKKIAEKLKFASEILSDLEPTFYGVPRDMLMLERDRQQLVSLASQAKSVVSSLYLQDVLFPNPSECPELQTKVDALRAATEKQAPSVEAEDSIPF
jgi:hypothetical protein